MTAARVTFAATVGLIIALGLAFGVRVFLHSAVLALCAVAFLPFVVTLGVLFLLTLAMVLIGAHDNPVGELVVSGGQKFGAWYYPLLWRGRHPIVVASVAGLVCGLALLGAYIAALILPKETRAMAQLQSVATQLDAAHLQTGHYPKVFDAGIDTFGHAITYERTGVWKLGGYRLRSLGYDGVASSDDLCITEHSALAKWLDKKFGNEDLAKLQHARCD